MISGFASFFRPLGIFFASALAVLVVFGLLLGAAWSFAPGAGEIYKLLSSIGLSALAVTAGGWLAGRLARRRGWPAGALFGVVFGLCSFSYLTGDWRTFVAAPLAAFFGGIGGWIADRWQFEC
jgi:hypothetical protein